MTSVDTKNNTTQNSTDVITSPSPSEQSSSDTDSGSTKPTSASDFPTPTSSQDQPTGKKDTEGTVPSRPGTPSGLKTDDIPSPISTETKETARPPAEDKFSTQSKDLLRIIPLANYFKVDFQNTETYEALAELSSSLPLDSVENMLQELKQTEMKLVPPLMGVGRVEHMLSYMRLQARIANLFKESSEYEVSHTG